MAKKKRRLIKMQCQTCKRINYYTYKNPISTEKKLEFKKFCRFCKKHTSHKESKK